MFFLLLTALGRAKTHTSSSTQNKPIVVYTPTTSSNIHSTRSFKSLSLAKTYLKTLVSSSDAESIIKRMQISSKYSSDMNTLSSKLESGNTHKRIFSRNHVLLAIKKESDGTIKVNSANVDATCKVLAEKVTTTTTTKKIFFDLIPVSKSTKTVTSSRTMTAAEIESVYNRVDSSSKSKLNTAINKVKTF